MFHNIMLLVNIFMCVL